MNCANCGKPLNDGEATCPGCGAPAGEAAASSEPAARRASARKEAAGQYMPVVLSCAALVGAWFLPFLTYLVFLILLGMFIYRRVKKRPFPRLAVILGLVALAGAVVNSAYAYSLYSVAV